MIYLKKYENYEEEYNTHTLLESIIYEDLEYIERWLEKGNDIDFCLSEDATLLWHACNNNKINVVKFLIEKGANLNKCEQDDYFTPLITSCFKNYYDIAKILIENGADVNKFDISGGNALHRICNQKQFDPMKIAKLLVENGIDINHKDNDRETPLLLAFFNNHYELYRYLIMNNAIIDTDEYNIFFYHTDFWKIKDNQEFIFINTPYAIKDMMSKINVYPDLIEKYNDLFDSIDLGLL